MPHPTNPGLSSMPLSHLSLFQHNELQPPLRRERRLQLLERLVAQPCPKTPSPSRYSSNLRRTDENCLPFHCSQHKFVAIKALDDILFSSPTTIGGRIYLAYCKVQSLQEKSTVLRCAIRSCEGLWSVHKYVHMRTEGSRTN